MAHNWLDNNCPWSIDKYGSGDVVSMKIIEWLGWLFLATLICIAANYLIEVFL